MYCSKCGTQGIPNASFCGSCGFGLAGVVPLSTPSAAAAPLEIAGLWPRCWAFVADNFLSAIPAVIVGALVALWLGAVVASGQPEPLTRFQEQQQAQDVETATMLGFYLGALPVWFLYHWISTAVGGGLGKRMYGLRVVDAATGAAPGYGKALGRVFVSVVSKLAFFVGYLWSLGDPKRRTWHDMACGTVVVRETKAAHTQTAVATATHSTVGS
jgi:uncharacterized RDD family membrane protein YckC